MQKLVLLLITSSCLIFGQDYKFLKDFGQFKNAAAISVTQGWNIFVSDIDKNEIYKFDENGKRLHYIGGFGWSKEAFDEPIDLFATPLNIYVADKNNNRIQIFDRELNFLSIFQTHESEADELSFNYPSCVAISSLGDLFILDSDNNRILKYDLNGNFLQQIGNFDSGSFKLNNPLKFSISRDGRIFVLDGNQVIVFDQFGNGISKIKVEEDIRNISIYDYNLTLTSDHKLLIIDLKNLSNGFSEFVPSQLNDDEFITDSALLQNKLYILTKSRILEFIANK